MSDAIVLDVPSASPVQLDVGDADPIAREEIAALAGRVTTVEGDVSGLSTRMGAVEGDVTALDGRMDAAEGDISTLGTTVDGIDARVDAIEADYVTSEDVMGALGGEAPTLVAGSSRAVLGDVETASWMERTTAADGAALIEAIYGNTVVQDGSLLPVRMEGIETVGFNQWDGTWENGAISSTTGQDEVYSTRSRSFYIPVFPNTEYYHLGQIALYYYDSDKNFLDARSGFRDSSAFTTPVGCRFIRFMYNAAAVPRDTICINISDPSRNGTYEPYWRSERAIPASTYFPDGMRSAGSVRDELTETAAIHRVAQYTFTGTEGISFYVQPAPSGTENLYIAICNVAGFVSQTGMPAPKLFAASSTDYHWENIECDKLPVQNGAAYRFWTSQAVGLYPDSSAAFIFGVFGVSTSAEFNNWLAANLPTVCYEVNEPTTTPIDPPLALSYRTGAGGTERVMVASGTTSAPPIFATRYPLDPADLAASIAPVDGPIAATNHQVGDLLMLGFTLCKATQVIVTGEVIAIGTNVTRTTVAAELAALSE